MLRAKDLIVKVVPKKVADAVVIANHYSGKVCQNSQISFGVYFGDLLMGALQYGPSIDKRRTSGTIGVGMNEYLELNRMAMHPDAPKNSESRAISVTLRMLRKQYPHLRAILSFADGTQCGDGTIYRASGFMLVDYKKNIHLLSDPDGEISFNHGSKRSVIAKKSLDNKLMADGRFASAGMKHLKPLPGMQFKYVYFFDEALKKNFTPIDIGEVPAEFRIYKGQFGARGGSIENDASGFQPEESGANPTPPLQANEETS